MKDGFLRAGTYSPELSLAHCKLNAERIIKAIEEAKSNSLKLLVLPELAITGYTCGDLFSQQALIDSATDALGEILTATQNSDMLVVVSLPISAFNKLYNCSAVLQNNKILGVIPKEYLPTYGEFYEGRNFAPAFEGITQITLCNQQVPFGQNLLFCCQNMPEFVLAVEICEDLWVPIPPSSYHAIAGATVIANCSASDEGVGKSDYRRQMVASHSARLISAYIYCNCSFGESTTDMVFAGQSLIGENGSLLAESTPYENALTFSEIDLSKLVSERRRMTTYPSGADISANYQRIFFSLNLCETSLTRKISCQPFVMQNPLEHESRCEEILSMQAQGLRKRLAHTKAKSLVLGISGGLDSTLAMLVCKRALDMLNRPATDIVAVTMPCFGTTQRTKSNAELLAEKMGATLRTVDIADAVNQHFKDIGHNKEVLDVVFENSQARERTQILMNIANQTGGLVIGTGDLSELALGWATYNGDHMSMYGVNSSIPKTLVRHLVAYEADKTGDSSLAEVLRDVLATPVSPELLPAKNGEISQKTEDLVGPYELHDFFLYYIVRFGFSPKKVYRLAVYAFNGLYDSQIILKWLKIFYGRFFSQQFKRSCLPDGPKVGSITLSPRGDWRMPSDASSALWLKELEEIQ